MAGEQSRPAESGDDVAEKRPDVSPYARAIEWVAKITTVGLEMTLPAVAGHYVDGRWGTRYWALAGLVVGMMVGLYHLLQMTRSSPDRKRGRGGSVE